MGGLALERSDRPGLANFLAKHRRCNGGIDIRRHSGGEGSMIRVTCMYCGQAIEAPADSWEGWWEEQVRAAAGPVRRFEPSRRRPPRRRRRALPPRAEPATEPGSGDVWRRRLTIALVSVWVAGGVVLLAVAISAR